MNPAEREAIEISLLLEAIFKTYGYDFRNYADASMRRRIMQFAEKNGYQRISGMIPEVIHDRSFFQSLAAEFSITVTEMFRDPLFYRAVREQVVPVLKSWPSIRVWHAGCATGEEVFSMAILLMEEGLYDRATIFATDINENALEHAGRGIFSLNHVREYTRNYQEGGGKWSFSDYYHASHDHMIISRSLKENITFAAHNLVVDRVFSEMHLVLCRNVMIYFDRKLQDRVFMLFDDSLARGGFLCLGSKESIRLSSIHDRYRHIDRNNKIYQKIIVPDRMKRTIEG